MTRGQLPRTVMACLFPFLTVLLWGPEPCLGQSSTKQAGFPNCSSATLPAKVKNRLIREYKGWRILEPSDMQPRSRERWQAENPSACPGIAVGEFQGTVSAYVLLLISKDRANSGFRLLVFTADRGQPDAVVHVLEQSDEGGAGEAFIRSVPIAKFFDNASQKRFAAHSKTAILFIHSNELEYEARVFYWTKGKYRGEPVDY